MLPKTTRLAVFFYHFSSWAIIVAIMTIINITNANNMTFIIFIISMIKLVRDSIDITFNITIMTMIMLSLAFRDGVWGASAS